MHTVLIARATMLHHPHALPVTLAVLATLAALVTRVIPAIHVTPVYIQHAMTVISKRIES
jgi:hypothetical protein